MYGTALSVPSSTCASVSSNLSMAVSELADAKDEIGDALDELEDVYDAWEDAYDQILDAESQAGFLFKGGKFLLGPKRVKRFFKTKTAVYRAGSVIKGIRNTLSSLQRDVRRMHKELSRVSPPSSCSTSAVATYCTTGDQGRVSTTLTGADSTIKTIESTLQKWSRWKAQIDTVFKTSVRTMEDFQPLMKKMANAEQAMHYTFHCCRGWFPLNVGRSALHYVGPGMAINAYNTGCKKSACGKKRNGKPKKCLTKKKKQAFRKCLGKKLKIQQGCVGKSYGIKFPTDFKKRKACAKKKTKMWDSYKEYNQGLRALRSARKDWNATKKDIGKALPNAKTAIQDAKDQVSSANAANSTVGSACRTAGLAGWDGYGAPTVGTVGGIWANHKGKIIIAAGLLALYHYQQREVY